MPALKLAIIIFGLGAVVGLIISPFTHISPNDILASPTQELFARQEPLPIQNNRSAYKPNSKSRLATIFKYYDKEQVLLNSSVQILGTSTKSESSTTIISQPLSLITGTKIIALFGDSMVDTMETNAPYLQNSFARLYPNMHFTLQNYGIGAQPVTKGLARLKEPLNYKDRQYPSILESNADIYIIDSFAYNPLESIDEYTTALTELLTQFKASGKPVYLLATIAPLKSNFGKGPGGVNWDSDTAWTHATKIQTHLEKSISIANSLAIPVIDCYHPTLQSNGEGIKTFVNSHDGIHPSVSGHQFIAQQIAQSINLK